jgi:hypothetical protein
MANLTGAATATTASTVTANRIALFIAISFSNS